MKKIVLLFMIGICLASCSTSKLAGNNKLTESQLAAMVADSIEAGTLHITFNYVNPMRFRPQYLTYSYTLRLNGDSISSNLPYFGRAYRADYGSTDSPLSFEGHIDDINVSRSKKDRYQIDILTRNKLERLEYSLTLFDNGRASLYIDSNNREPISFDGEMDINGKK